MDIMTDIETNEEGAALGRHLKDLRERAGLSQDSTAARLRIPRSAVSDIERGFRAVSAIELGRYSDLLDRPLETLLHPEMTGRVADEWEHRSLYSRGVWRRLTESQLALIGDGAAYEGDGLDVLTIGEGKTDDGLPHLGVWQRAPRPELESLPLFELTLTAGPMQILVYVGTRADLIDLLPEITPTLRDLHAAQLDAIRIVRELRALEADDAAKTYAQHAAKGFDR